MAVNGNNGRIGAPELSGVTFGNVDLADRDLVTRVRERDLDEAETRIKDAVRRLQQKGVIDGQGRRLSRELPPDMREDSTTDFGG